MAKAKKQEETTTVKEGQEITNGTHQETHTNPDQTNSEGSEEVVTVPAEEPESENPPATTKAKAGKRSAKALKEVEEKQAKEERKAAKAEVSAEDKPKVQQKPPRSRLERRGKKYRQAAEHIEKDKVYPLAEGLAVIIKTSTVKFDASVELHVNLDVDPRQADQNIRGSVGLPAGTGKTVRIAVLADDKDIAAAQKAGADKAGNDALLAELDKGVFDFDILIATPAMMPKLGKYARVLGPKGLMPNPKSGTVTPDVTKAVTEAKAGRVEYRVDTTGIIHLAIGKVSFGAEKLTQNAEAVLSAIKAAKPASIKGGIFVKAIHLTTTMGPSVRVTNQ